MPDRSRLRWVAAVAATAAVAVGVLGTVTAAGQEEAAPAAPVLVTPQGTEGSPVTWRVRFTGDGAVDAVVVAYQRYLGTTVRLEESPDPADPALPVIAVGTRLAEWQRHLAAAVRGGTSARGPVTATAGVVETGPSSVTLQTCTDYTRQRAGSISGGTVSATVVLVRVGGAWKVSSSRPSAVRCR